MSGKYSFRLKGREHHRELPDKVIIGHKEPETVVDVILKLFAYLLFYRERIQIDTNLHADNIAYVPDIVQLDYELRPKLWVECGDCTVHRLDRLAVKVPEAEIWVIKRSASEVEDLLRAMDKGGLRRNRYGLIGLDAEMFDEVCGLVRSRNDVFWMHGDFEPPEMQYDFNGLWFDAPFGIWRF